MEPLKSILVTGGAGYIGCHVVNSLLEKKYQVVVLDDLSTGDPERLSEEVKLYRSDIRDNNSLKTIFSENRIDAVVHLAARKSVFESIAKPNLYKSVNADGTTSLVDACNFFNINKMIFSSTCAVYGNGQNLIVTETSQLNPESPYAESKLSAERVIQQKYKGSYSILRFFNVIGTKNKVSMDRNYDAIMPAIFKSIESNQSFKIYGKDYNTFDGTCERDYIDVRDIADAHLKILEMLDASKAKREILNLGRGTPISVLQILNELNQILGNELKVEFADRRKGDVESIFANIEKAKHLISFYPKYNLKESLISMFTQT